VKAQAGPTDIRPAEAGPAGQRTIASAAREILLIAGLFGLYECGRMLSSHPAPADQHAASVWHFERWTHLPSEVALQSPLLARPHLAEVVNGYYAWVHFPVTVVVLACLWWRRPGEYRSIRTVMAILTFSALLVHFAYPLAPPRMLTSHGMVDLARRYGPAVYGTPGPHSLSDQYAAMPSLHVAWAAVVALVVIRLLRTRWRWLALAYPVTTTAVVLVTGNHYWVDAFVGLALLAGSAPVAQRNPADRPRTPRPRYSPSPEPAYDC
jgi:membrane-associated phospholipid phosphatase